MRLTRDTWIRAAYRALESGGVECVQVEPLARALKVSKGSFYWHFADRGDLLGALLEHWGRQSSWFRIASAGAGSAPDRLERLAEIFTTAAGQRADLSMLRWAQRDRDIAPRVTKVLERRLGYVAALLRAHGLPAAEATWRAQAVCYAYMGWLDRTQVSGGSERKSRDWIRRLAALALAPPAAKLAAPKSRVRRRRGQGA